MSDQENNDHVDDQEQVADQNQSQNGDNNNNVNSNQENAEEGDANNEQYEDVEEEVEEDIPAEELEELKKEAESNGKDPSEIATTRVVTKMVKRQVIKQPSQDQITQEQAVKRDVSQISSETKEKILWIMDSLEKGLNAFDDKLWNEELDIQLNQFFTTVEIKNIYFWVEKDGLKLSFTDPPILTEESYDPDFQFFVKYQNDTILKYDPSQIEDYVSYGSVQQNHIQSLLKLMDDVYNPQIYSDTTWPENVKKEFIAQLHKFMATLTEASQQNEGYTKLYIPKEDLSDTQATSLDKDLIQRLETTLIYWYRQIKEIVNNQDSQQDSENAGPQDEIIYWRRRKNNLQNIQRQLVNPDLQRIIQILKLVDSSYVPSFEELTKNINTGSVEAENNLDFLNSLFDSCRQLEKATPREIPSILPSLLNRVRMIWEHSDYYNSQERISGLLHKISNEIIKRCKSQINISDMLDGDVEKCIQDLKDSIECGMKWKKIYERTSALINKKRKENASKRAWDFNHNSIFAQMEAFVQRCSELTEICEGQLQFAGKGSNNQIPQFGGSIGPEIENILEEIKESFKKHIDKIRATDKDKILDVKASNWHDLFNMFKNGMKDLDIMYQNIINTGFEQVSTVQQGAEMLEAFDYLAKRDSIKMAVKKKASEVIQTFLAELDKAKLEYDNMKKNMAFLNFPLHHGKYSGQAIWVRAQIHKIQKMKDSIDRLYFIDDTSKRIAQEKYETIHLTFKQFIVNVKFKEWKEENKELEEIPLGPRFLDKSVLLKPDDHNTELKLRENLRSKEGHLESNFDRQLEKLMHEVVAWKKLINFGIVVPSYADEFTTLHRENLRILKEYVMLVVRDQNKIIDYMDPMERNLFKDHYHQTEKVIQPGLLKLKWSSKGILETFVRECRRSCNEIYNKLKMFKGNTEKIEQKCQEITSRILIKIDKKRTIEIKQFEEDQERHRRDMQIKIKIALDEIKRILSETYEPFLQNGPEIQKVWFSYVAMIDKKIEEALKKANKNSLLELYRVIGDDKNPATAIFRLSQEIDQNGSSETGTPVLVFKPTQNYLKQMIQVTTSSMTQIIQDFKRMTVIMNQERKEKLEELRILKEKEMKNNPMMMQRKGPEQIITFEEQSQKEDYFQAIASDLEIKKYTESILNNLEKTRQKLESGELQDPWKKRSYYWESEPLFKHKLAKSFLERDDEISNIRDHIEKFEIEASEIQAQKTTDKLDCIVIDNTNIKSTVVDIIIQWQSALLNAVQEKAISDLNQHHSLFQTSEAHLEPTPLDIHQLKKNMDSLAKLKKDKPEIEIKLKPLEEKFKLLEDYQINLKEDEIYRKNTLRDAWIKFVDMLERMEIRNQKVYNDLYQDTMKNLDDFMKEASDNKITFMANAPFQVGNLTNEKAFQMLNEYKENIKSLRDREREMRFGFDLFNINYAPSPELESVEKEISNLQSVWKIKDDWDKEWEKNKHIKFREFNNEVLDDLADDYQSQINSYPKEMKKWEVVNALRNNVEQFRQTLPLIKMLGEKFMRQRHWDKLQKYLQTILDYDSDSFTLQEIFKINLLTYADSVREVCEVAREEYKIESALANIETRWGSLELVMDEHKKGYYKVKRADDIFSALEDHMGILSAQKTTLFYESFKTDIETWETALQNILETLEALLQVQRQWIYLESIFASQQNEQDKQLVGDIAKFGKIEKQLQKYMSDIFVTKNAKQALSQEGFLTELTEMSRKLDESQKILFQLLERNRKEFPRFYFLSNDDLFEILGNSKDPSKVNKHIKKCFEGIKKLHINTVMGQNVKGRPQENHEVITIISPEGERVNLSSKVTCEFGVEKWLKCVELRMIETLKKELAKTHAGIKKKEGYRWVEKWIPSWPGQLLIIASQLHWTQECGGVLHQISNSEKSDKHKAWKPVKDDKNHFLAELTKLVRKPSNESDRLKLIALITIEVHAKDIIESLQKTCFSDTAFDWLKQLRFYHTIQGDCMEVDIKQTNTKFPYGYEYQGNNGRLVITALTDRCYMTLTTAMKLNKGGAPQGPAGTGKTETVKDLGKGMGKFVLVFNCSEGLDYKSIGRMFSGLIQTGGWGCFDEFNRIEVEVLSVVAQQMHSIMNALRRLGEDHEQVTFDFEEEVISINDQMAIFITMNPGYAGRSELPDNLKSLFRPISMMVPETTIICEIMLQSEGFKNGRPLSIKMVTLYNLMTQQLSKQDHYDFGLRAIKSVLNCAGAIRRNESNSEQVGNRDREREKEAESEENMKEQKILMRAINDMNMPKFVQEDIYLFNALFNDLFPNTDLPESENTKLYEAIELELRNEKLIPKPEMINKAIQLYDSKNTRHGNMLVGKSLSGKTTTWKILQKAMTNLNKQQNQSDKQSSITFPAVRVEVLNPKTVTLNELFGFVDHTTLEWNEGVLSSMMSRLCKDESNDQRWMILDGPVDTLWIESMNTVLDDNKVLTLLNGDRISLPQQVGLVFEVEDLSVASPATVSRAGMIYIDSNDLGWRPYIEAWIGRMKDPDIQDFFYDLVDKWIMRLFKTRSMCKELVPCSDVNIVIALCRLMDSFIKMESHTIGLDIPLKNEIYYALLEKWFTFALIWSFGATVDEDGRKLVDYHMRDIESIFPHSNTVYDYFINVEKNEWASWEDKINASVWKPGPGMPYHKMLVPTVDSARNRFVIQTLLKNKINTLVVGNTGTGKTAVINGILSELDDSYTSMNIVFSSQTNSLKTQDMIESKLVRRTKYKMIPDGKKMVIFVDDLNMPRKDTFGSQPPLELFRQWMDYEGWFDRQSRDLFKQIIDIQFIAAMGPPGGGRAQISRRTQGKFNLINFTFPTDNQVRRIFQSILNHKFHEFEEEIKPLAEPVAQATLNLFRAVSESFLPTPKKSHYVFNLRDISKVIQGVYMLDRFYCDSKLTIFRLWVHECLRVFHDRLISFEDRFQLKKLISDQLEQTLGSNMRECTNEEEADTIFIDFMEESGGKPVYIEIGYKDRSTLKQAVESKLDDYNKNQRSPMPIVLFEEAISYVCKIHRIIKLGKGHGMLVGEGGSGRHSLTRLAAFIASYSLWQIEISRNYRVKEFRDDIKRWAEEAGYKGKSGVFLFSDNQIINEGFIEDINNILTVGEVPNLFSQKDDYPQIKEKMKKEYIKHHNLEKDARIFDEDLIDFFFTRVQNNFHLMLCMSKTGDSLRNYTRMYPGLVNNTTIIWYMPWPEEALLEVANKYLKPLTLQDKIKEVSLKPEPIPAQPAPTQQSNQYEKKEQKDPKKIAEEEAKLVEERIEEERREGLRKSIATFFSLAHTKVLQMSDDMYSQLKRMYYVTPTNYIELVKGYVEMLEQKQKEYGNEITKLRLGLYKLDEAGESSELLKQQLQISQIQLQKSQKEVEDLMIKIEGESRDVNEKQKYVEQKTVLVEKEKGEILRISADAEQDLQAAMPALRMAEEGLANLNKNKLAEVKSFTSPPAGIDVVMQAIMILLLKDPSWASAKKELAAPDFLSKLENIEKDKISQKTLLKIEKLTHDPKMSLEKIQQISEAGASMWRWVLAMEMYAKAFKDIEPKRIKVNQLKERLAKSEEELNNLQENLQKLQDKIFILQQQLEQAKSDKQNLEDQNKILQDKQERAEKLISGLEGTKEGWKDRKIVFEQKFEFLIGDSLMSAAFMSYAGPFPSEYRRVFIKDALFAQVRNLKISHSRDYNFPDFLVKPITFLNWNFKGLPDDQFSRENAVLVTKSSRFPLMIDPQQQANTWIKNTERDLDREKLQIIDPQTENYITLLERAISWGQVVILQNLDEEIDPALEPILNKSLKKVTGGILLCLGADKEIKFYMTTKLANPKYKAEVSTRVTLVNFAVKEEGLQDQLISVVIQKMEANLEKQKNDLVRKKADNESKLKDLDDKILRMLQETKGQLIDDLDLIKALQIAKETEEDVRHQIETGAAQMTKTMNLRKNYVSLATTASKLFFVINEFGQINNMYQFSLESYIQLFQRTIDNYINKGAAVNDSLNDKLNSISEKHKEEIYKYACRGLFENDKLLLSIQMAVRLSSEINIEEFNFFLRGSEIGQDRKTQPPNANPDWITQQSWDTICDLDKMGNFTGIIGAFTHNSKEWKRWYMSSTPESDALPGEWDTKCDHLRKLIIVKTIRPDRVIFSASQFVENKIGPQYIQAPSFTFESVFADSTKTSPVIFILSPGVDPHNQLQQFADLKNSQLVPVSLGQGQARKAREKVAEGCKNGYWLYLANCHLSLSFLKELEKIIENLEQNRNDIHDNFRLWLSSSPHPKFPISILQKCVKVTTEPSKGVKSNMIRLYNNMPSDKYQVVRLNNKNYYKKLVFSLCWFHSIIVERKRFKQLGWNVTYDFNDSDWETADNILQMYIDQQVQTDKSVQQQSSSAPSGEQQVQNKSPPWDAIRFLISDVTYGGRVTDDWDRRLLNVYATTFFNDTVIFEEKHKLGDPTQQFYSIPEELNIKDLKNLEKTGSELQYYRGKIEEFPSVERPETFGQHINAEISSQIVQSSALIESIISLSPNTVSAAGISKESKVANIIKELMEKLPELIDVEEVKRNTSAYDEGNPLRVVLNQEIDRYNKLLVFVRQSLINLDKGIQGIQLISEDLEIVLDSLFEGRVPSSWKYCYYSLKPLSSWIEDLIKRIDQLRVWGEKNQQPNVFWISGFSFPTGFTTALLQQSARKLRVPIDQFGWDFSFLPYDTHISTPAKEGAYISGLYLEGAKWDGDKNYIVDAEPMKLHYPMPVILFKPVYFEGKQKQKKGESKYACPTYIYPQRTGVREKPSYMFTVMLPIKPNPSAQGTSDQDFWVKRGTALLMSLAD